MSPTKHPETLKIEVTPRHIARGKRNDLYLCPLAWAIREKGFARVCVQGGWVLVNTRCYDLPKAAIKFIRRFDNGLTVKPFTFELKRPPPVGWRRLLDVVF